MTEPRPDGRSPNPAGTGAPGAQDTAGASPSPATTAPDPTPEQALTEMRDRWQRAVAEADNARKRCQRQLAEERTRVRAQVAAVWLPVLDHLELALQHADADPASIVAGVAAVRDQAVDVLARLGYRRVDEVGARFDPARHEATAAVDAPDAEPGTVVAVVRPGYAGPGELLRPATVVVARERDR